jgi:hypothetical protein
VRFGCRAAATASRRLPLDQAAHGHVLASMVEVDDLDRDRRRRRSRSSRGQPRRGDAIALFDKRRLESILEVVARAR